MNFLQHVYLTILSWAYLTTFKFHSFAKILYFESI